jgi:small subunit ribosomal protein S17
MKKFIGQVISLKMQRSAVVDVTRLWAHPLYQKSVKRSKKYTCDFDPAVLQLEVGDTVEIVETRPISKTKFFKVTSKIGK